MMYEITATDTFQSSMTFSFELKCPTCLFCFSLQSHYAQQARRSRSVTRKRKREASAPPASKVRSQSASRPPRDQSGMRDVKVCDRARHHTINSVNYVLSIFNLI